jgi:hypothetical protein
MSQHFLKSTCLSLSHPALLRLNTLIPFMPVGVRKDIMTLCRVQQMPRHNPYLRDRIFQGDNASFLYEENYDAYLVWTGTSVLPLVEPYIRSPVILGFISQLLRCLPYKDETSARQEIRASIQKEMDAALGKEREPYLDYSSIFGTSYQSLFTPLSPLLPPRPHLASFYRLKLRGWLQYYYSPYPRYA